MRNLWTGWVATEGVPVPSLERKCGPGVKPGSGAAGLASDPHSALTSCVTLGRLLSLHSCLKMG